MPRKGSISKRKINSDPKFGELSVAKFINYLMVDGKKSKSEKIFYESLEVASKKLNKDPLEIFQTAMDNVKPNIEVRSRRVGGATYQVPMEVNHFRKQSLAIRWIISSARNRSANSMVDKLSGEIMDAYQNKGGAIKKKEDTGKMAEANRAFAHYRW